MAFTTKKKPEPPKPAPKPAQSEDAKIVAEAAPPVKKEAGRALVSIHPSEMKAVVTVGGKSHKVVYHVKDNKEPMIGLAGEGSVSLTDWLTGKAELQGLK